MPVITVNSDIKNVKLYINLYSSTITMIGSIQTKGKPFRPRTVRINIIIIYWIVVLVFAINEVTILRPLCSIAILKPVTKRSRKIISPTIQNSIKPINANEMNAEDTKILSAKGSRNLPSGVISLYFLA